MVILVLHLLNLLHFPRDGFHVGLKEKCMVVSVT